MKKILSLIACVMMCSAATASDDLSWSEGKLVISTDAGLSEWMTHRAVSKDELIEVEFKGNMHGLDGTSVLGAFGGCASLKRAVFDIENSTPLGERFFRIVRCSRMSISRTYLRSESRHLRTARR